MSIIKRLAQRTTATELSILNAPPSKYPLLHTDGFRNNRESGFTLCDGEGRLVSRVVIPGLTNNHAELLGINAAAQACQRGGEIRTDSQVCCYWIRGKRAAARPDLTPLVSETAELIQEKRLQLRWVRRDQNLAGVWNEKFA